MLRTLRSNMEGNAFFTLVWLLVAAQQQETRYCFKGFPPMW